MTIRQSRRLIESSNQNVNHSVLDHVSHCKLISQNDENSILKKANIQKPFAKVNAKTQFPGMLKNNASKFEKKKNQLEKIKPKLKTKSNKKDSQKLKEKSTKPQICNKLIKWQRECVQNSSLHLRDHVNSYLVEGFTIFKNVLNPNLVNELLNGDEVMMNALQESGFRRRCASQLWSGAKKTVSAHIKTTNNVESVISPVTTRDHGRYDLPLPRVASDPVMEALSKSNILEFAKYICKSGKFRTQDIMLSRPGAVEQKIHTDSSWDGKKARDPRVHYLTILIPLTKQTSATGGTRVWPKSHRNREFDKWNDSIDVIDPLICIGDALVFDGLLAHCGMGNNSSDVDRFFYYAAYACGHDPNTDVTGV